MPDIPRRKKHKVPKKKPIVHYPSPAPKLTIIAIWNPSPDNKEPIYLPNFFASIAANPSIDLLFIKYDRHRVGTPSCGPSHVKNMRQVCLSFEEYWKLHADFLCKRWGGCSTPQRQELVSKLHERAPGDRVRSHLSVLYPQFHSAPGQFILQAISSRCLREMDQSRDTYLGLV